MNITKVLFLVLLCLSLKSDAKEWSTEEKLLFTTFTAFAAADALQTHTAMNDRCGCFKEQNPIYGNRASDLEIAAGFALSIWGMHSLIEQDAPRWLTYGVTGLRAGVVLNNHSVGVRINMEL